MVTIAAGVSFDDTPGGNNHTLTNVNLHAHIDDAVVDDIEWDEFDDDAIIVFRSPSASPPAGGSAGDRNCWYDETNDLFRQRVRGGSWDSWKEGVVMTNNTGRDFPRGSIVKVDPDNDGEIIEPFESPPLPSSDILGVANVTMLDGETALILVKTGLQSVIVRGTVTRGNLLIQDNVPLGVDGGALQDVSSYPGEPTNEGNITAGIAIGIALTANTLVSALVTALIWR